MIERVTGCGFMSVTNRLPVELENETTDTGLPNLLIDMIVRVESGLFILGGLHDPGNKVESFGLLAVGNQNDLIAFSPPHPALRLLRTLRRSPTDAEHRRNIEIEGFVAFLPSKAGARVRLATRLRGGALQVGTHSIFDHSTLDSEGLNAIWPHSGTLFLNLAERVLPPGHGLTLRLRDHARLARLTPPTLCLDQVLQTESALLCLYGWSPHPETSIRRLVLMTAEERIDLTRRIHRIPRPDLAATFPELVNASFGLFLMLVMPPKSRQDASLFLETTHGETAVLALSPRAVAWTDCEFLMRSLWPQTLGDLPILLEQSLALGQTRLAERLVRLRTSLIATYHGTLPLSTHEVMSHGFFAIDRAWALGAGGLLLMGWRFDSHGRCSAIHLHSPGGPSVDITDRLFAVPRPDVAEAYRSRFPEIPGDTGFVCWVPLPTEPGEIRLVGLRRTSRVTQWLRLPDTRHAPSGLALVHEIFNHVPHPRRMRRRLHALFDAHLGPAISAIAPRPPPKPEQIEIIVFGTPPAAPRVSILVPLYGRYDFLRHQLAQFADDPDFQDVDLLYLVDDPHILNDTLELATVIAPLFGLPFRIAHAGANLGYAAINNLGARLARAETLLLLNSDVIPLHPGWLGTLLNTLAQLPEAGAVAPLLFFPEGAVQHAGMVAGEHPMFPGFRFNLHPGKWQPWIGTETPSEHVMLSAACLLLRTTDYLTCGGLDEGYRVGDFEDGDLCLELRQRGKRLYLAPASKLCHLERQSQRLADLGDWRMLLTLYNAWRFGDKIRTGQLPDPRRALEG